MWIINSMDLNQLALHFSKEGIDYTGIFFMFSGAEIRPLSQWDLGDFFPI